MPAQKIEGIILRKYSVRETSYILSVYTRDLGKVKGILKGIRKPYPQFAGNFEIFSRCELMIYRRKKRPMDLITHCEALDFYLSARKDIERLTYANYFIELLDGVTRDNDPNSRLYDLLVSALENISGRCSPRRAARIYELRLLKELGIGPRIELCCGCGKDASRSESFSVEQGGMLCADCLPGGSPAIKISRGTANFMKKISETDLEKAYRVKVSAEVGRETEKVLGRFLAFHINRSFNSLKFLKSLKRFGIVS